MKTCNPLIVLLLLVLSVSSFAERTPGFSMAAFKAAVPRSSSDAVFSPFPFELDCALISEAFGPMEKAVYVEALGALVGYDSVFKPISEQYTGLATNDFVLVSARAFLASSIRLVTPKYRSFIQDEYRTQVCPVRPVADGAESYLKATMDGEMEDFSVTEGLRPLRGVSFCDLESLHCRWSVPFPKDATRPCDFVSADGSVRSVAMMNDVRTADIWKTDRFSMLRLPMTCGAFFFAVLPSEGAALDSVREDFAAEKFDAAMVAFRAVADPSVFHGTVSVALPRLAIDSVVDLKPVLQTLALPIGGFKEILLEKSGTLDSVIQRTRFVLDERGLRDPSAEASRSAPADRGEVRKFICNRPFLFFVYHEPTRSVPVAGIFAGGVS